MSKLDRRQFSSLMTLSGLGLLTGQMLTLTGCGRPEDAQRSRSYNADDSSNGLYRIVVYDLLMTGWSIYGSGRLGPNGVLKASVIRDGVEVTMNYIQDPHGHKFTLTPADFDKLKRGEKVEVITTEAQGHKHKVVIDPALKPANAESIEITNPSNPSEKIFAMVDDADEPRLFVEGSKALDPASVEYCVDTKAACDADAALWKPTKVHLDQSGRQVLVSDYKLALDAGKNEIPLMVRGKLKDGSQLIEALLKFVKK